MKKKRIFFVFLLAVGVVATIAGALTVALSSTILRNGLILRYTIRGFRKIVNAGVWSLSIGATFTIGCTATAVISRVRKRQHLLRWQEQRKKQSQLLAQYAKNSTDPVLIRKVLAMIQEGLPGSKALIDRCLEQMNRMDTCQDKQRLLIEANAAHQLDETVETFNEVENRNFRAIRSIINLCIAVNSIDELDMKKVNRRLNDNSARLNSIQELLQTSVDWINDDEAGDRKVNKKVKVLNSSIKERLHNEFDDEEEEEDEE